MALHPRRDARRAVDALGARARRLLAFGPGRERIREYVAGDPDARRDHLRTAGVVGGVVLVATVVQSAAGVVVSPAVWDFLLWAWLAYAPLVVVANGYWRGGLAAAAALPAAPLAGALLGVTAAGAYTGVGFRQVAPLVVGTPLVLALDGLGRVLRRGREAER